MSTWTHVVGWTLIHFVWQGAVLAALCSSGFTQATHWHWRTGIFVTQTTWQNYSRQERQKRTLWGAQEAAPNNVAARSVANPT